MFRSECHCVVVVGVQWGDEGKGKIVDVLSEQADLVVRYQGGANAGHTVVKGDDEFILHQIPAGILHDRTRCVIGNGVVLDPETLVSEINELRERGVSVDGRLFVSDRAHLVLPYHKALERISERSDRIGTTRRGIGPTYEDKVGRRGVRVGDLLRLDRSPEMLDELLEDRIAYANRVLGALDSGERVSVDEHRAFFTSILPRVRPLIADTGLMTYDALHSGDHVLLEGAQGALLDVDHGTYPFVTSSNTTAGGAAIGVGIGPTAIDAVLGVVKAYTTRVGNGPLPTEADAEGSATLRSVGAEFGATTKRPRRCGWFDAVVVRYAARVNGLTDLAVTKLDVLDAFATIPVCVGYRIDGEDIDYLPADAVELARVVPVYEYLEGWNTPTSEARYLSDLPVRARAYLDRLQDLADVPVRYVSVGTRRDQIIGLDPIPVR